MYSHHGVLAHQHDALAAQRVTDLVHLLRRDIVHLNNENALVLLQQPLKLVKVSSLVRGSAPHIVCAV